MEDTLRVINVDSNNNESVDSLNPCCNGRYSQSRRTNNTFFYGISASLNPCCNGRYSQRPALDFESGSVIDSLNPCCNGRYSQSFL